jgi:hypothetical protein
MNFTANNLHVHQNKGMKKKAFIFSFYTISSNIISYHYSSSNFFFSLHSFDLPLLSPETTNNNMDKFIMIFYSYISLLLITKLSITKLTIICVEKLKDHEKGEVVIKEDEILKYQVQYSISIYIFLHYLLSFISFIIIF